ncbi:hypothetical protein FB446DRAFT_65289 [Lentinula raphanica]|nr:hypothetical protein FB446DRAFT_65289 [Lentinula raphanica]
MIRQTPRGKSNLGGSCQASGLHSQPAWAAFRNNWQACASPPSDIYISVDMFEANRTTNLNHVDYLNQHARCSYSSTLFELAIPKTSSFIMCNSVCKFMYSMIPNGYMLLHGRRPGPSPSHSVRRGQYPLMTCTGRLAPLWYPARSASCSLPYDSEPGHRRDLIVEVIFHRILSTPTSTELAPFEYLRSHLLHVANRRWFCEWQHRFSATIHAPVVLRTYHSACIGDRIGMEDVSGYKNHCTCECTEQIEVVTGSDPTTCDTLQCIEDANECK